ncbi:Zinc finger C2H2 [Penicillium malachiteum]|uniref:Zinc finger C2H2 n=1 Tax=Penicillium malachiteum TaxID=1324776 RepID=UPI002547BA0C|nr:Zinc finger C2H2 [Penicillium malachiteum]KAJ5737900.1 Zinc finger C2H2 [Penicillium malachiteum]
MGPLMLANTRGADLFGKSLVSLGHRSGYDKKHSESIQMKFAGHINLDTYGKIYTHPLSEIDGPANYSGIISRQEHIQNRCGIGLYHTISLPQLLPAKSEYKFLAREDVSQVNYLVAKLSAQLSIAGLEEKRKIQLEQKRLYSQKRFLSSSKEFSSIRKVIMVAFLRKAYFTVGSESCPIEISLLLYCYLRSAFKARMIKRILYQESLSLINESCLCGKYMDNVIYGLRAKEINAADLLRCDPLIFPNAPIKAGLCPFCLVSKSAPASRRMRQFVTSPPQWHSHIKGHLEAVELNFDCKHPACSTSFESLDQLTYHLIDVHCWRPRRNNAGKRKRSIEE